MSRTTRKSNLNWADDVEAPQHDSDPEPAKQDKTTDWHADMNPQRGAAKHRLNLNHGFVKQVVRCIVDNVVGMSAFSACRAHAAHEQIRNQHDRDKYEQQWQSAYKQADEYGKKWGRVKVPPQQPAKVRAAASSQHTPSQPLEDGVVEGIPVPGYPVIVGNAQYMTYGVHPYAVLHQVSASIPEPAPASPRRAPRVRLGYAAYKPPAALGKACSLDPSEVAAIDARGPRQRTHDLRSNEEATPHGDEEADEVVPASDQADGVEQATCAPSPPPGLATPRAEEPADVEEANKHTKTRRKSRRRGRRRKSSQMTPNDAAATHDEEETVDEPADTTTSTVAPPSIAPQFPRPHTNEVVLVVVRPHWAEVVSCAITVRNDGHVATTLEARRGSDPAQPVRVMLLVRDAQRLHAAPVVTRKPRPAPRGVAGVYQPPKRSTLQDLQIVPVSVKLHVEDGDRVAVRMHAAKSRLY